VSEKQELKSKRQGEQSAIRGECDDAADSMCLRADNSETPGTNVSEDEGRVKEGDRRRGRVRRVRRGRKGSEEGLGGSQRRKEGTNNR
jgi:hypothetical protein